MISSLGSLKIVHYEQYLCGSNALEDKSLGSGLLSQASSAGSSHLRGEATLLPKKRSRSTIGALTALFEATPMTTTQRTYRGIPYDPAQHERLSPARVDHTYRGQHYDAPLCHTAAVGSTVELHYRGSVYRHRREQARKPVNS